MLYERATPNAYPDDQEGGFWLRKGIPFLVSDVLWTREEAISRDDTHPQKRRAPSAFACEIFQACVVPSVRLFESLASEEGMIHIVHRSHEATAPNTPASPFLLEAVRKAKTLRISEAGVSRHRF